MSEYDASFAKLQPTVPDQNLDRRIQSKSVTILQYHFEQDSYVPNHVRDISGNDYHGQIHNGCQIEGSALILSRSCYLRTPLSSKGRDYMLSFWVKPSSAEAAPLFAGKDSALWSGYDNFTNVTMVSGNHPYSLNYSLPLDTWTHVQLTGSGHSTTLTTASDRGRQQFTHVFNTRIDTGGVQASGGNLQVWVPIAFEAPLERIGEGFEGQIKDILLEALAGSKVSG